LIHEYSRRIRLNEVDAQGIMYYAVALILFDEARIELLREVGFQLREEITKGREFRSVKCEVEYMSPITFDEVVNIRTLIDRLGRSSVTYYHEVESNGNTKLRGKVVDVFVDKKIEKAIDLPSNLREKLSRFLRN
jgi:acyl-CoA thioester hydrolase